MLDAKVELDGRLRTVINDFTNRSAAKITEPISQAAATKRGFDGLQAVRKVQHAAEKEVPLLRRKLVEYLDDARTKETLVGAVLDQVVGDYEAFYGLYVQERRGKGNGKVGGSKKGKGREDEVWDVDMFAEWCGGVFRVGRAGFGEGGSRSRSVSRDGSV